VISHAGVPGRKFSMSINQVQGLRALGYKVKVLR